MQSEREKHLSSFREALAGPSARDPALNVIKGSQPVDGVEVGFYHSGIRRTLVSSPFGASSIANLVPSRTAPKRRVLPLHSSGLTSWKPKSATTAAAASQVMEVCWSGKARLGVCWRRLACCFLRGLKFSELGLSSFKGSLLPQQVSPLALDGPPIKVSSLAVSRRVRSRGAVGGFGAWLSGLRHSDFDGFRDRHLAPECGGLV